MRAKRKKRGGGASDLVAQSGKRAQGQLLREKVPGVVTTVANKTWATEHWMQREGQECRAKKPWI